jgi:DNA-binding NarL/FixJ family response regulator
MCTIAFDKLEILIVDAQQVVREGIKALLKELKVARLLVYEASCFRDASDLVQKHSGIDVTILNPQLPDVTSAQRMRQLSTIASTAAVVCFSDGADADAILAAYDLGARAYVAKSCSSMDLIGAILVVLAGGRYFPPELVDLLRHHMRGRNSHKQRLSELDMQTPSTCDQPEHKSALTRRQREVLMHLRTGMSNKEICRRMGISAGTVKNHVSTILRQLGAKNRGQAAHLSNEW